MPLRERLVEEAVKRLYENVAKGLPILRVAEFLGIGWKTAERLVNRLKARGYVEIQKQDRFPFGKVVRLTNKGKTFASELTSLRGDRLSPADARFNQTDAVLLAILYAVGGKVEGATRLEKLPFLLEKEYGIKIDHLFKYFPYLYGPYSSKVMQTTYRLAYFKLITIEEKVLGTGTREEYVMKVYKVTPKGEEVAKKIFEKLPEEHQNALRSLEKFNKRPLRDLLHYVYTKYPEVKKYTTLDEFFY